MLVCDLLFRMNSFSVTSTNIAINNISLKLDSLGYISAAESVGVGLSSTTITVLRNAPESHQIL